MVSPKELLKETLPPKEKMDCEEPNMMKKRVRIAVDAMGPKYSLLRHIKEATMRDVQAKQLMKLARDGETRKFVFDNKFIRTRRDIIFVLRWRNLCEKVMKWCHDFMHGGCPSM